jgi:HEAT repeat protein
VAEPRLRQDFASLLSLVPGPGPAPPDRADSSPAERDQDGPALAEQEIRRLGKSAVGPLANALLGPDDFLRGQAVRALRIIDPPLKGDVLRLVLPRLIKSTRHAPRPGARKAAAAALGQLGADAAPAADALVGLLRHEDWSLRAEAARALGAIGPPGEPAVPALEKALADPEWLVRYRAAAGLGRMGPKAERAVAGLGKALKDSRDEVRSMAAEALGRVGPASASEILALAGYLGEKRERRRPMSRRESGGLGRVLAAVDRQRLLKLMGHPDAKVRTGLLVALQQLAPDDALVAAVEKRLTDPSSEVRDHAAVTLEVFGPLAARAVPALAKTLDAEDDGLRWRSLSALEKIGSAALPKLKGLEAHRRPGVRAWFLRLLAAPADDLPWARPVLARALLKDPDSEVRQAAAGALGDQDAGGSKEVLAALTHALKDDDATVRRLAAKALGRQGRGAISAVDALLKLAQGGEADRRSALGAVAEIDPVRAAAYWAARFKDSPSGANSEEDRLRALEELGELGRAAASQEALLLEAARRGGPAVRIRAVLALGRLGTPSQSAIDTVAKALSDPAEVRDNSFPLRQALGLGPRWLDERVPVRLAAARSLAKLGPKAAAGLPGLRSLLGERDPALREAAALALAAAGRAAEPALPALLEHLDDKDQGVRQAVSGALGGLGSAAVEGLAGRLRHAAAARVRGRAAAALKGFGPGALPAMAALLAALDDPDWEVRSQAADALAALPAKEVVPALEEALRRAGAHGREWAADILARFGDQARTSLSGLVALLGDRRVAVRAAALAALERLDTADRQELAYAVAHRDGKVRRSAALALARAGGPNSHRAVPELLDALHSRDPEVRRQAAAASAGLRPPEPRTVRGLQQVLDDPDPSVRAAAVRALAAYGHSARLTATQLDKVLGDSDLTVRYYAYKALSQAVPGGAERLKAAASDARADQASRLFALSALAGADNVRGRVDLLRKLLRGEKDAEVRRAAAVLLGEMGSRAREALPELVPLLEADDPGLRLAAVGAVGAMGPYAGPHVPGLARLLRDPRAVVQARAAEALAGLGPAAGPAVADLGRLLDSKFPRHVRLKAAEALRAIGDGAYPAMPALAKLLDDPDPALVQAACGALGEQGRLAFQVIPKLERLQFSRPSVQRHALCALNRIGNDNWAVPWEGAEARCPSAATFPPQIPRSSTHTEFDPEDMGLGDTATLKDAYKRLRRALGNLGYDLAVFRYPNNGFVIVTNAERFNMESKKPDFKYRFNLGKIPRGVFDFGSWLEFFSGQRGHFRVFVFVFGDVHPQAGSPPGFGTVKEWVHCSQLTNLPKDLLHIRLAHRPCSIYIYHFQSLNGFDHQPHDQPPTAMEHLEGAGLMAYLQRRRVQ